MKYGQVEGFKNAVGKNTTLQFIPFKTIIGNFSSTSGLIQLFENIILLIPIAFFLKYLAKRNYSGIKIIMTVCICSVAIEIMQLIITIITIFPMHATDIDDVILNTLGVALFLCITKNRYVDHVFKKFSEKQIK